MFDTYEENPADFLRTYQTYHKRCSDKFKLKGTGTITYHLGMDFLRDKDKNLCMAPRKYIEKICGSFERMFGHPPKQNCTSPIEKNDHPELDNSELLDEDWTQKY